MSWQINYAIEYLRQLQKVTSAHHILGDSIRLTIHEQPDVLAVISAADLITAELATQYYTEFPDMDFLCGYRKGAVWEGGAIDYLEARSIGWGSAGTLSSAIQADNVKKATHKDYFFSYRLISQMSSVARIDREFDRVFTMTLASGSSVRIGMIMEYEPTADSIRSFVDRFGSVNIAWCINPNGYPTQNAIKAGQSLGCEVMKWNELKGYLQKH